MHLLDMDRKATSSVEFSGAMAALEVFGLLMLHQDYAWALVSLDYLSFVMRLYLSHLQNHARSTSTTAAEPEFMGHMSGRSLGYSLILLTCFCFFLTITPRKVSVQARPYFWPPPQLPIRHILTKNIAEFHETI